MNPHPIYVEIGSLIRTRRKALRMTQGDLAAKLAISRGSLANVEIGRQNVLVHQLYGYASALGLQPNDLLPATNDTKTRTDWSGVPLPDDLKPSQKEQLARLLEDPSVEQGNARGGSNVRSNKS